MIPFLDAAAIRGAVSTVELLDAVESAYRDVAAGRDRSPIRTRLPLGEGDLLLMPGLRDGGQGATVKIVTVMGGNAARGLPTVQATVVWLDGTTGRPRAILDGTTLTAMRTGAASGVGTRLLARPDASTLAVLGAGRQAEWQVHAVAAARPIRRVAVYARSAEARIDFAGRMADATGLAVDAVDSPEAAVRDADIVCCATTSSEPVFDAAWLKAGAHVNGIGAYRLGMVEIPAEAFGRATLVAVDSVDAAREEAGDVMAAVEAGSVDEGSLVEIGSVGRDWAHGRDPGAITIFKSVGLAIQDVAAAELVVARLLGDSIGP
ncbi:MAG TPA: ornithine cyclodeaminase family protein [Candidatus Limnocylindria bacterium]|nr:ornithine cyclodeaminase family protein [Candidatus Limnocylindria bacterium]